MMASKGNGGMAEHMGEEIKFDDSDFVPMADNSFTQTSIMPLLNVRDDRITPIGTCFCIANSGLCLTARHVIEEAFHEAFKAGRVPSTSDGSLNALYASQIKHESGETETYVGGLIPANKIYFSDDFDLAVLHLNLPVHTETGESLRMPALRLGLAPPKVGETCLAIGYHAMQWDIDDLAATAQQSYSATRGVVEELHIPQRDSSQLNFPCFRTSARFDGGMSGAPVMTTDGLVRGVVCSSFKTTEDIGHTSYASLVAPSILLRIEGRRDAGDTPGQHFLWEFVLGGAVSADVEGVEVRLSDKECAVLLGGGTIRGVVS